MSLTLAGASLAAAGIGAAAGAAQTGLSLGVGSSLNQRTRHWAERQAELQYQRSLNIMQLQNEYNRPEAQRQRLKDAGLSVGLMYGGNGNGGVSADAAAPQMASYTPIAPDTSGLSLIGQAGKTLMEGKLMEAQINKLNADAGNAEQDTKLKEAVTKSQEIENLIKQCTTPQQIMQAQANLDKTIAEIKVLNADELLKSQQQMKLANDLYWDNKLNALELLKKQADIALTNAKTDESKQRIQNMKKEIEKMENDMYVDRTNMNTEIEKAWIAKENMYSEAEMVRINQKQLELDEKRLNELERHNKELEDDADWQLWINGFNAVTKSINDANHNVIELVKSFNPLKKGK